MNPSILMQGIQSPYYKSVSTLIFEMGYWCIFLQWEEGEYVL